MVLSTMTLTPAELDAIMQQYEKMTPFLNVPDDLRTECPALTPDTCEFYELAFTMFPRLLLEIRRLQLGMTTLQVP